MDTQELDGLLAAHFAGTLDAEGQKRLGDALLADEAARRRFVELADQDMALRGMTEARQQAVPGSWFLVPGSEAREPARSDGSPRPRPSAAAYAHGLPSVQPGTRNQPLDNGARGPEPVEGEPGTAHRRRPGWLVPALAAAALIVVSFLFASGILPSGSVTIKEFRNTTGRVVKEKLSDGTRLAIAPGAKLAAKGRDEARCVRQLIQLESGEVEVTAPKALPGEIACRVETPEGLWVETVGTTFKVTRIYENEKGERNVDKSKLMGPAIAAVLLVTVSEGCVKAGSSMDKGTEVAAGGEAVVRVTETPKTKEEIAWGQAVNGLRMGLSFGIRGDIRYSTFPIYDATLHFANVGTKPLKLTGLAQCRLRLSARNGQQAGSPIHNLPESLPVASVEPGRTVSVPLDFGPGLARWRNEASGQEEILPKDRYTLTATYTHPAHGQDGACPCWHGEVSAGPVEDEMGGEEPARQDVPRHPTGQPLSARQVPDLLPDKVVARLVGDADRALLKEYLSGSDDQRSRAERLLLNRGPLTVAVLAKVAVPDEKDAAARERLAALLANSLADSPATAELLVRHAEALQCCAEGQGGPFKFSDPKLVPLRTEAKLFHCLLLNGRTYRAVIYAPDFPAAAEGFAPFLDLAAASELFEAAGDMYGRMAQAERDKDKAAQHRAKADECRKAAGAAGGAATIVN